MKNSHGTPMSDEQLAAAVQRGDGFQFGVLVERYEEKLLRYGRKFLSTPEDIEDIVQEVFMSAYQNIKSFDTAQRFSPWVYRIAHNAFVNGLKKQSRSPLHFMDLDTLTSHPVYENPDEKERDQKEVKEMIDKALSKLDPKNREVLVLFYLENMPYKDIAEVLQIPIGTVGIRVKRAREALKQIYSTMELRYE